MAKSKDGLDGALEFTKFIITLDSGLIAFSTGTTMLAHISGGLEIAAVIIGLFALATSVIAGIFVYMRCATKLSDADYDLSDRWLAVPGMINVSAFALGAAAVAALAIFELLLKPETQPAPAAGWKLECVLAKGHDNGVCNASSVPAPKAGKH